MDRKLGIVVFSSFTGLGYQSHRLTQMLLPEKILLIDNSSFTLNREQHPEWYDGFSGYVSNGFPNLTAITKFLQDLTHLYIIENPLNWELVTQAQRRGIKVYIASNYEFCDNLIKPYLPLPDLFLMPSHWKLKDMQARFGESKVKYLPPPVFPEEFKEAREVNFNRTGKRRFLHVVGTLAAADRNGTLLVLEALKHSTENFELVIKSQHPLPEEYTNYDHRVKFEVGSDPEIANVYRDFDALILPRRFGGLCLPMQEALLSGLPVIMPDISPNKEVLPETWLMPAKKTGSIQTRSVIDLYAPKPETLAQKIDEFCLISQTALEMDKLAAFEIGHTNYAPSSLQKEYEKLWSQ